MWLREALGYDYGDVAEMLNKTAANCRKIFSRAKHKIRQSEEDFPGEIRDAELLAKSFLSAVHTGNFTEFVRLLTDDAVLVTDAGGKRRAAIHPIFGRKRIQVLFESSAGKRSLKGEWLTCIINGQEGLVLVREQKTIMVVCFAILH